jgi:SAM-dependent methyltransferase
LRRERILSYLSSRPPGRLLEIGCGAGALLGDLLDKGFDCEALETSPEAFSIATELHQGKPRLLLHKESSQDWAQAFDYVLAFEVLEHIEDDRAAIEKWRCWVKPGGKLLLSVPAHPWLWNATDVWAGHFRRYQRQGLKDLITQAGFDIDRFESYGFPLSNIIEPIRARVHAHQLAKKESEGHAKNTQRSGVDRSVEARLYPLQASWPGTKIMQGSMLVQRMFCSSNLGTGYLVAATKR